MKGFIKVIIAGAVIIVIGLVVLIIALGLNGWTFAPKFETEQFIATEENTSLSVNLSAGRIKIEYTDEEYIQVSYPTAKGYETNFNESGGKLTVDGNVRKWYTFGWGVTIPETVVKIPQGTVTEITVTVNAGTVDIPDGEFEKITVKVNAGTCNIGKVTGLELLDITLNSGAVNISSVSADRLLCGVNAGTANIRQSDCLTSDVRVSAGSVNLTLTGEKTDYTATVNVSAGSCNGLSTQSGGDKTVNVRVSAGSCNVSFAG